MTRIIDPSVIYHISPYAESSRVESHNGNPPLITRLSDGRHVSANASGQRLLDRNGQMETWGGSDQMTPEAARATWRGTDPNVTTIQAPGADETARIRAELAKRYPGV